MKNRSTNLKTLILLAAMAIPGFVFAQCQAAFTYSFSGPNVVFTNNSIISGQPIYTWNFGDNTSSSLANPVHAYNAIGTYMVCLTAYDSLNNCQSSTCDTVIINSACGMVVTPSSTNESSCGQCDGTASVSVTGGQAPYTYSWSNSATTASLTNLCHNNYSVMVTDANGCTGTANVVISCPQQNSCQASFTSSVNGYTVTFTNTTTGTMSPNYSWNFGDNQTSNAVNPTHNYNSPGVYPVYLVVWDSISGCQSGYVDSVSVMVGCGMNINMVATNSSDCIVCDGSITTNVTGGTAPYTYSWSNNSTGTSLSNLCSGYYSLTVTDATGCIITGSANITCPQQNSCQAGFTYTVNGNVVTFTNTSTSNSMLVNYYWSIGNNVSYSGATPPPITLSNGVTAVCLTMSDSIGPCTSTFCDSIVINSSSSCGASFIMIQDSLNPLTWYVFPTVSGQAPFTYIWSFGDNTTSTAAYPTHNYSNAGQYTVCLSITDANGCTSLFCDSTSVQRLSHEAALANQMQYLVVMNPAMGVQENQISGMHVWPNPASDQLTIASDEMIDGMVRIIGLAGNLVSEQQMNGKQLSLDISNLPAGSYTITVNSGNAVWNQRIVILR